MPARLCNHRPDARAEAGFRVYTSFMAYHSGVYHKRFIDLMEVSCIASAGQPPAALSLGRGPQPAAHRCGWCCGWCCWRLAPPDAAALPAQGGHAIKIVGWGVEPARNRWSKPTPYWLCANSWTDRWGDKGFFKIRRGTDRRGNSECGIQDMVFAGHALLHAE